MNIWTAAYKVKKKINKSFRQKKRDIFGGALSTQSDSSSDKFKCRQEDSTLYGQARG